MKAWPIMRFGNNNNISPNYTLLKKLFCNKAKQKFKTKNDWQSVIGLEVHAQIASMSKLFSGASTEFGKSINSCVSFFDCATPGTLPVLNRKCVEAGVLTALALSCKVNEISLFDRKHYFYADLPAGYQITQQRLPLAVDGELKFNVYTPGVNKESYCKISKLKQIQLEQDSGKTIYDDSVHKSFIDLNRAGIPLLEFVFEPDLNDGEEAAALVKELKLILERLNTCSCKMDEGALRVDANISINRPNEPLGVRTEVKNIGSIRAIASAISYEVKRQISICENGGQIVNETRAWDNISNKTISMRDKEQKQDYRFMPEPNLPPLHIHVLNNVENKDNLVDAVFLKTRLPELPQETREILATKFQLPKELIIVLVNEPILLELFTYITKGDCQRSPFLVAKILIYQLVTFLYKNNLSLDYCNTIRDHLCEVIDLLQSDTINLHILQKILEEILEDPQKFPKQIVEKNNWLQITDEGEIRYICQQFLNEFPDLVVKYKKGKKQIFKFFMRKLVEANQTVKMKDMEKILKEILEK